MNSIVLKLSICVYLLTSCSSGLNKSDDHHLSAGNVVELIESFAIQELYSHVIFQDGNIINEDDLEPYRTSCIFDTHDLGPTTVQRKVFTITKVEYYEEMYSDNGAVIRYYTEYHLISGTDKNYEVLTCQILDDTMQYHSFPPHEIKQATGNYFSF